MSNPIARLNTSLEGRHCDGARSLCGCGAEFSELGAASCVPPEALSNIMSDSYTTGAKVVVKGQAGTAFPLRRLAAVSTDGRVNRSWAGLRRPWPWAFFALVLQVMHGSVVAQVSTETGYLSRMWVDAVDGSSAGAVVYLFTGADGRIRQVELDSETARSLGGDSAQPVQVRLTFESQPVARAPGADAGIVEPIRAEGVELIPAPPVATAPYANGNRPWVTILCRFSDTPIESLPPPSSYSPLLGELTSYWSEVSEGNLDLRGSVATGWHGLPNPSSHYVYVSPFSNRLITRTDWLLNDCLEAADGQVDFSAFYGINIQTSGVLTFGGRGGRVTMALDGSVREFGTTWIPLAGSDLRVFAHEMGHGLGMRHTNGWYGEEYGGRYDLMGAALEAVHVAAVSKERLGWIPPSRQVVLPEGASSTSLRLSTSSAPTPDDAPLIVRIPAAGGANTYYAVEARHQVGFDKGIPSPGVLIYQVQDGRTRIIDGDGDGDTYDDGTVFVPGEQWVDVPNSIEVRVDSVWSGGYWVTAQADDSPGTQLVTVRIEGQGRVTETWRDGSEFDCSSVCSQPYVTGSQVHLQAMNAYAGFAFTGWSGPCSGVGFCSFVADEDTEVVATFSAAHRLDVTLSGKGTVYSQPQGIFCQDAFASVCSFDFPVDSTVLLDTRPDSAHYLAGLTGACTGTEACWLVMDAPAQVTATFVTGPVLTLSVTGNGTVWGSGSGANFFCTAFPGMCFPGMPPGQPVTLHASGDGGFSFSEWGGACSEAGSATECVLATSEPLDVTAAFTSPGALSLSSRGRRTVVSESSLLPSNDSVQVQVTGAGSARWEATSEATWSSFLVEPGGLLGDNAGRSSAWLTWQRSPGGSPASPALSAGIYVDTITITANGIAGSPQLFLDTLVVQVHQPPLLTLSRDASGDAMVLGSSVQSRDSVRISVTGPEGESEHWVLSHGSSWLQPDAVAGTGSSTLRWSREPGALTIGEYVDTLRVSLVGDPTTVAELVDRLVITLPSLDVGAVVKALLTGTSLEAADLTYLDGIGNDDGQFNLGDVLALLDVLGITQQTPPVMDRLPSLPVSESDGGDGRPRKGGR